MIYREKEKRRRSQVNDYHRISHHFYYSLYHIALSKLIYFEIYFIFYMRIHGERID